MPNAEKGSERKAPDWDLTSTTLPCLLVLALTLQSPVDIFVLVPGIAA